MTPIPWENKNNAMNLISIGLSNRKIAEELKISPALVNNLRKYYRKSFISLVMVSQSSYQTRKSCHVVISLTLGNPKLPPLSLRIQSEIIT